MLFLWTVLHTQTLRALPYFLFTYPFLLCRYSIYSPLLLLALRKYGNGHHAKLNSTASKSFQTISPLFLLNGLWFKLNQLQIILTTHLTSDSRLQSQQFSSADSVHEIQNLDVTDSIFGWGIILFPAYMGNKKDETHDVILEPRHYHLMTIWVLIYLYKQTFAIRGSAAYNLP